MEGRHVKMLGIFTMLCFLSFGVGCYLFVAFHYHHVWSLFFIGGFLMAMFISPALCFGYNQEDYVFLMRSGGMDEQSFLNCRDLGYVASILFFVLKFVIPTSAWYGSDGLNPPIQGTLITFSANTWMVFAYILWLRIFIL